MREQKPQLGASGAEASALLQLTPVSCEVKATVELMTVGLPELVNAIPLLKRKKATKLLVAEVTTKTASGKAAARQQ